MKFPNRTLTQVSLGLAVASLAACGPATKGSGKGGGGVDIDSATVQQELTGNTKLLAQKVSGSIDFLNDSNLFQSGFAATYGASTDVACPAPDPNTGQTPPCTTSSSSGGDVNVDLNQPASDATDFLQTNVFTEANVETSTNTSVTYLLKGDVFCAPGDGSAPDPSCVSDIDNEQIRIVVTSPKKGDLKLALQIGPSKANPFTLEIAPAHAAVDADLAAIKTSAEYIGSVTGDMPTLPDTMSGGARVELAVGAAKKITGSISITHPVAISGTDYGLTIGTGTVLQVTSDGAAKTIETVTQLGAVDAQIPVTTSTYDDTTMQDVETKYTAGLHLGGLSGDSLLDAANEVLTLTGMGLGKDTATYSINGKQVVGIDLNKASGGKFDATITSPSDGSFDVKVSPKFDLAVALQFAQAADVLTNVDQWMMNDVLHVTLDGNNPEVVTNDNGVQVVSGTLKLSLENAGDSVTAAAGQCLASQDTTASGSGTGTPPSTMTPANPLVDLQAGTCN